MTAAGRQHRLPRRSPRLALIDLGGDLMQGYFFARPGPGFPAVDMALLGGRRK